MIDCTGCGRRHRTFNAVARCRWPRRSGVWGEGPWASFAVCRSVSIHLYATEQEALDAKALIDRSGCGGACRRKHWVTRLKEGAALMREAS